MKSSDKITVIPKGVPYTNNRKSAFNKADTEEIFR